MTTSASCVFSSNSTLLICIVVRNAQRKLAFFKEVGQAASLVLYGKQPIELFAHFCHTIARVDRHIFLQLP